MLSVTSDSVILVHKPLYYTSFDVIRYFKKTFGIRKIGHAGTLDPLATGLLILCTGKKTKEIQKYIGQEKEYTGIFTLGATTPSYDAETLPENYKDYTFVTPAMVENTRLSFVGEIAQRPPLYSALKKNGKPLYIMARKGETISIAPRKVIIKAFEITEMRLPYIHFRVVCGSGTYIRSLAFGFGEKLGCGAYLSQLQRERIGNFLRSRALDILPPLDTIWHRIKK